MEPRSRESANLSLENAFENKIDFLGTLNDIVESEKVDLENEEILYVGIPIH